MVCQFLSMYLCLYHLPRVCHTLVPEIVPCRSWNAPCIPVYWHAHVHDLQLHIHALDWTTRTTGATRVCHEDYWQRQVGECADIWYKRIQPTEIVEQLAKAPVWIKTTSDELTVLLLFCDVHIDKGTTLNLLQCLCVICRCRTVWTTVLRHHWHCCICSYCHNIISSGSPPVFLECASYNLQHLWCGCIVASPDEHWISPGNMHALLWISNNRHHVLEGRLQSVALINNLETQAVNWACE